MSSDKMFSVFFFKDHFLHSGGECRNQHAGLVWLPLHYTADLWR